MVNDVKVDSWDDSRRREANFLSSGINIKSLKNTVDDHRGNNSSCYYTKPRNSKCVPEIRIINPAIYAESINDEDEEEIQVQIRVTQKSDENIVEKCDRPVENSCGNYVTHSNQLSNLSIKNYSSAHVEERTVVPETYRCSSSISANGSSSCSSVPNILVERRCKLNDDSNGDFLTARQGDQSEVLRYTVNGQHVVHLSTTSLSNSVSDHQRLGGVELARRLAYNEWLRKKQLAAKRKKEEEDRAESRRRAQDEKLTREREEKERRDRENFLRWVERKRKEEENRKAMLEREVELQERLKSIQDKAVVVKSLCLRQWSRKKDEEQKEQQRKQRLKQQQMEQERKNRLEESSKAYEKWREKSKNRPKPATQGLLPHQKAKPSYINPQPWQPILNDNPEDVDQTALDNKKSDTNLSRNSRRKVLVL